MLPILLMYNLCQKFICYDILNYVSYVTAPPVQSRERQRCLQKIFESFEKEMNLINKLSSRNVMLFNVTESCKG